MTTAEVAHGIHGKGSAANTVTLDVSKVGGRIRAMAAAGCCGLKIRAPWSSVFERAGRKVGKFGEASRQPDAAWDAKPSQPTSSRGRLAVSWGAMVL